MVSTGVLRLRQVRVQDAERVYVGLTPASMNDQLVNMVTSITRKRAERCGWLNQGIPTTPLSAEICPAFESRTTSRTT